MKLNWAPLGVALALAIASPALAGAESDAASQSGAGVMTEDQVITKLHSLGYSNIKLQPTAETQYQGMVGSGASGGEGHSETAARTWVGTAVKNGQTVQITVDSAGHVTEG